MSKVVRLPGLPGPSGSAGSPGAPGTNGNSVLNGSGAPSGGTGVDGDFYIDTSVWDIYGPKTGGSWGSPTSLIGGGGFVMSQADVTASRALGTVYHNTGSRPIMVTVNVTVGGGSGVNSMTDASNPPTTIVGPAFVSAAGVFAIPISFWVLSGNYYEVAVSAGSPSLNSWIEWTVTAP